MNSKIGYLQVLASGIGFGFLGVFGRLAFMNGFTVGELLSFRFCIAAVILWTGLFLFQRRLIFLDKRQILNSILLGACGYAVFSSFYFESIKGLSISLAAMLLFTFPIFVNLGEHFIFKNPMSPWQWISLALAMIGMVALLWGDFSVQSWSAVFFGYGSAVTYSVYVLVSSRVQKNVVPLSSSLYVITATALTFAFFHQPDFSKLLHLTAAQSFIIIGIASLSTILPLTLFLAGLQKMPSGKASIIVMIEPVTAALAGFFILNESMGWPQILGTLIILTALVLNALKVDHRS